MFEINWTPDAAEVFHDLQAKAAASLAAREKSKRSKPGRAEGLFKQVFKCVSLLGENPRHPGLRTHEYHSMDKPSDLKGKVFEAYVQNQTPGAYRLFWCYGPEKGQITIIAITPHP